MLLQFTSDEHLTAALTSKLIPPELQSSGVRALRCEDNCLIIDSGGKLTDKQLSELKRFGVKDVSATTSAGSLHEFPSWWHLIRPQKSPQPLESLENTRVIFRVHRAEEFVSLALEMLRLGNDRQSFRHVGTPDSATTLLRVTDPPYYALLRATEPSIIRDVEANNRIVAFIEQAPRLWVEFGYVLPQADFVSPAPGTWCFVRADGTWWSVAEGPFQDMTSELVVQLNRPTEVLAAVDMTVPLQVRLKLASGNASVPAEMWVLEDRAVEQVEELITRSDDQLIDRLAFAVIERSGEQPWIVLRTRQSRSAPPVLVLDATGYAAYLKLNNLFLPAGTRLHPPLRRDAVAKRFADDSNQITWLKPLEAGDFQPCSVPDTAFRPLSDWVEYVIGHNTQILNAWVASHQFALDAFVTADEPRTKDRSRVSDEEKGDSANLDAPTTSNSVSNATLKIDADKKREEATVEVASDSARPSREQRTLTTAEQLRERLERLEKHFMQLTEPLDSPVRFELWQKMAAVHSHLRHRQDTTLCWSSRLWPIQDYDAKLLQEWLFAELRSSGRERIDLHVLDEILAGKTSDGNLVAAYLVFVCKTGKGKAELQKRLESVAQYMLREEAILPIRTIWLGALALYELGHRDTLGLARTRDRLLERLFRNGLQGEFDVPSFLRGSGLNHSDRGRTIRLEMPSVIDEIDRWITEPITSYGARTKSYARFIGAYALARLGDMSAARILADQAVSELDHRDTVHRWLAEAYKFRVDQVLSFVTDRGELPRDLVEILEIMDRLDRYKIDRVRQQSRILEPHQRIDPYRRWHGSYTDDLAKAIAEIQDTLDPEAVRAKLTALKRQQLDSQKSLRVLSAALEAAPRVGEAFAMPLLSETRPMLARTEDPLDKAMLLQKGIYAAAHFGADELIRPFVKDLQAAVPAIVQEYLTLQIQYSPADKERLDTVESLFQHSFKGLRRLGMRDEMNDLYNVVAASVPPAVKANRGKAEEPDDGSRHARSQRLLLCVAGGWYHFGKVNEASAVVDRVRDLLFLGRLNTVDQRGLAAAYIHAVAQGPTDEALTRIRELFAIRAHGAKKLHGIEDTMTTSSHFSVSQLDLVETAVLALLGDESLQSPERTRLMDEDEYLIRKRIHADIKRLT